MTTDYPLGHALQLQLLGGFECRLQTGAAIDIPHRKARALLAYLATTPGRWVERGLLATLLWEDSGEAQARANLRKTLSRLRQALPRDTQSCLRADTSRIALNPAGIATDVHQFERCAQTGTPETLEQADVLYRGGFLQGMTDCGPLFEEWAETERRRLDELALSVLQHLLDHFIATGAIDRAIQVAIRLLGRDPLLESVHRQLIELYLQQDRIGSALEQYRRCRDSLACELGIKPSAETERLKALLQQQIPRSAADAPPAPETDDVPERATLIQSVAKARERSRSVLSAQPSIAVLCFADGGIREERFPLGESLAEDLAAALGRFRELDVLAPSTVFSYRDAAVSAQQIGAELGVAYVCEGHLRTTSEHTAISICLIEVASSKQLWAERYDGDPARLFLLQDEIIRQIGSTLIGRIEHAWLATARRKPPRDWQAYDFWLRGRSALRRPGIAALEEARRCFQQALARDPHFARAYVGLAMTQLSEWGCFSWNHWVFPGADALDLAQKAVTLDDHDHQAHCILGMAQIYKRDYEGARYRLLRALELNPNDTDVLAHAAAGLALIGEHDIAVDAGRRALRLTPHYPEWYAAFAGIALFSAHFYEEAIMAMMAAPEALCNTPAFIAASYAYLGQENQGIYYRDTVRRHYHNQVARGQFPPQLSCIDWLLALDPFQRPADFEHYADGLRRAGFE
ncbi:MAG: hypothetical protein KDK04_15090 [Candidatus Competibacteraceae bacterium]|nr:hypothetical protein [Candidatus Competibacteraceae bacterium]MCB1813024.1 hypothetical protein [Candidatus Competibacteraceae bacterium]